MGWELVQDGREFWRKGDELFVYPRFIEFQLSL